VPEKDLFDVLGKESFAGSRQKIEKKNIFEVEIFTQI
jgi:hypothetical protein